MKPFMLEQRVVLKQEHKATRKSIILTNLKDDHIKHLIMLGQDPDLTDLMGWQMPSNLQLSHEFIQAISSYALPYSQPHQPIVFGIYLSLEDLPIGYVVLKGLNPTLSTTEIGAAVLDKRYRQGGYGKLALSRMCRYTFDELRITTIGAAILSSNQSSINMCKRLGFVIREVMYDSWKMPDGRLLDMLWMELSKEQSNLV